METKICGKCNMEVDIKNFPKWRTCCRRCCYKKHDEWKKKNKKILTHICIDCGTEHTKIIYAKTEKINDTSNNEKNIIVSFFCKKFSSFIKVVSLDGLLTVLVLLFLATTSLFFFISMKVITQTSLHQQETFQVRCLSMDVSINR